MSGKESTSAWYWAHLVKYPDASSKVKAVKERGRHGDKPKVYCKAHLEADIRAVRDIDHAHGSEARSDEEIAAGLWSKPHTLRQGWMIGNSVTMLNHLKNCPLVPQAVREKALQNPSNAGTGFSSPSKRGSRLAAPYPTSAHDHRQGNALPALTGSSSLPSGGSSNVFGGTDDLAFPADLHHGPFPADLQGLHRSSSVVSLAPSDSVSAVASQSSRQSRSRSRPVSASFTPVPWDANKQALFAEKVLRLTVSANIPFAWVENPEWVDFRTEFIPQARPIGRTTIGSTPAIVLEVPPELLPCSTS